MKKLCITLIFIPWTLIPLFVWGMINEEVITYDAYANDIKTLDEVLEDLAWCESRNSKVINYNDGNEHSYYWLQFQKTTWNEMKNKYNLPNHNINKREHQFDIARKMLADGMYNKWYNCSKKLGYII